MMRSILSSLVVLTAALSATAADEKTTSPAAKRGPAALVNSPENGTTYLFIDDAHVEALTGLQRVYHQPIKEKKPVIVPDRPWERDAVQHRDPPVWSPERGRWQFWYYGGGLYQNLMYAESADGLVWEKPVLGQIKWKNFAENNIIDLGSPRSFKENHLTLVRDERDPNPEQRYKGLAMDGSIHLKAWVSKDGLTWKPFQCDSIQSGDHYRLGYDALRHRFVATVKITLGNSDLGRSVGVALSDDFVRWTKPKVGFFVADETDQQLGKKRIEETLKDPDRRHPVHVERDKFFTDVYNMPIFTYADMYLGLPVMFNRSSQMRGDRRNQDGILYPMLVASHDLTTWDRLSREPFIPHSPLSNKECWDHAMIHSSYPVRNGDELWFYYTGARFTHMSTEEIDEAKLRESTKEPLRAIFRARLRLDGFASLRAGEKAGVVVTKPVKVSGPKIYFNANARGGELRAELRHAESGQPLPGYTFTDCRPQSEDATHGALRWDSKGDVSELRGRTVRVAFSLRNAHLYSFGFSDK